jgi:hypothetical protein
MRALDEVLAQNSGSGARCRLLSAAVVATPRPGSRHARPRLGQPRREWSGSDPVARCGLLGALLEAGSLHLQVAPGETPAEKSHHRPEDAPLINPECRL